ARRPPKRRGGRRRHRRTGARANRDLSGAVHAHGGGGQRRLRPPLRRRRSDPRRVPRPPGHRRRVRRQDRARPTRAARQAVARCPPRRRPLPRPRLAVHGDAVSLAHHRPRDAAARARDPRSPAPHAACVGRPVPPGIDRQRGRARHSRQLPRAPGDVRPLATIAAALLVLLGSAIAPAPTAAQRVERVGSGAASVDERLDEVLAGRYLLVARDTTFGAADTVPGPVLVLGATLIVEGVVAGDLVAVDSEVYLRPTARIVGDAVNIGGGLYRSEHAVVQGLRIDRPEAPY